MKLKIVLLAVFVFLCSFNHVLAAKGGIIEKNSFSCISDLTNNVAAKLREQIGDKKIALDKSFIKNSTTGEISNFSSYLKNELESSLTKGGFTLVDDVQEADYFITVSYQKDKSNLRVFVKYRSSREDMAYKSLSSQIKLEYLPQDAFVETLDAKAEKLARKIALNQHGLKVLVNPIVEGNDKYSCPFSNYLTQKIKTHVTALGSVEVIGDRPIMTALSNTRGLGKKAREVTTLTASDAVFVDANAVLEGLYFMDNDAVNINLTLKDVKGKLLASADERIDKSLVKMSTENSEAKKLSQLADVSNEMNGNMIKISTSKGSFHQIYYAGEFVKFNIMVAKPLHVYIYDINAKGEVELLYPANNDQDGKLQPRQIYAIPAEQDNYNIEVKPPFGTDTVKVFACEQRISSPTLSRNIASRSYVEGVRSLKRVEKVQDELAGQSTINQDDLVDYFRGAARRLDMKLYEDHIYLETRER